MNDPNDTQIARKKRAERFPFLALLLLVAAAYLFWGLPRQLGERPMQVSFGGVR